MPTVRGGTHNAHKEVRKYPGNQWRACDEKIFGPAVHPERCYDGEGEEVALAESLTVFER